MSGSGFLEIVLWFCFLIPGLIYSLWRGSSRKYVCPSCSSAGLIPSDSPVARAMTTESSTTEPIHRVTKFSDEEEKEDDQDEETVFGEHPPRKDIVLSITLAVTILFVAYSFISHLMELSSQVTASEAAQAQVAEKSSMTNDNSASAE